MTARGGIPAALLILSLGLSTDLGLVGSALVSTAVSGVVSPAHAQDSAPAKRSILTIDQELLFTRSLFGERVVTQINADLANLEQEFQRLEADLTAEEKELTQKRATLEPDAFRKLADAFDEKVQGIRKAQDAKARELDRRLEQERAKYYGLVNPILYQIMEELDASVIIDRRAILAGVEGVDITKDALQMIDATLGDGSAPAAPVPADE